MVKKKEKKIEGIDLIYYTCLFFSKDHRWDMYKHFPNRMSLIAHHTGISYDQIQADVTNYSKKGVVHNDNGVISIRYKPNLIRAWLKKKEDRRYHIQMISELYFSHGWEILTFIRDNDRCSMKEISQKFELHQTAVTRKLKRLAKYGFLKEPKREGRKRLQSVKLLEYNKIIKLIEKK